MKFLNIDHNLHQSHMRARCLEETWPTTPVPPRPPRRGPPWPAAPFSGHHRHYASHEHHPHRNNSHDLYFLFRVHFPPTNITITPALQTVKEKYRPRSFHCSAQVFIIIIVMIIIIIFIIIIIIIGWRWDEVMYQTFFVLKWHLLETPSRPSKYCPTFAL